MNNQHPITPPPGLTDKWNNLPLSTEEIFVIAAQWGADQELEACCEWFANEGYGTAPDRIRNHRRPKSPTLKEQALADLDALAEDLFRNGMGFGTAVIRRAVEALPND
jgi:hypothetical protein